MCDVTVRAQAFRLTNVNKGNRMQMQNPIKDLIINISHVAIGKRLHYRDLGSNLVDDQQQATAGKREFESARDNLGLDCLGKTRAITHSNSS